MGEFDKYIVQGEPDKKAKANAWQMTTGRWICKRLLM